MRGLGRYVSILKRKKKKRKAGREGWMCFM